MGQVGASSRFWILFSAGHSLLHGLLAQAVYRQRGSFALEWRIRCFLSRPQGNIGLAPAACARCLWHLSPCMSSLEFLDRARHGDEHGRVGGRRGGVGVSKRERNALAKESEPGLLGGKRLRLRQDRREKRRQKEAASQPQSTAMRMLGSLSIGSIHIILP